jgi:hypothetical protein
MDVVSCTVDRDDLQIRAQITESIGDTGFKRVAGCSVEEERWSGKSLDVRLSDHEIDEAMKMRADQGSAGGEGC